MVGLGYTHREAQSLGSCRELCLLSQTLSREDAGWVTCFAEEETKMAKVALTDFPNGLPVS